MALVSRIDHLVLTVASLDATCEFYERVLGAERKSSPGKPTALQIGASKLNVHQRDHTFEPKAEKPTPGSADFCVITEQPTEAVLGHLRAAGVPVELGPVERNGAQGSMTSVYVRDPDGNLTEISRYH